jgi:hypothetical protein
MDRDDRKKAKKDEEPREPAKKDPEPDDDIDFYTSHGNGD